MFADKENGKKKDDIELRDKEEEKDEKDIGCNFISESIASFIFCF